MIKYDVEGEKQLPFSISKILLVSTVNGNVVDDPENIWNIDISQINDIYMYIDKTTNDEETIKEIELENFTINQAPQKGDIKIWKTKTNQLQDKKMISLNGILMYAKKRN